MAKMMDFYKLLVIIIGAQKKGLPLGYYTSQWFANFYLQEMDYFLKQELKVVHYIRYMDKTICKYTAVAKVNK